MWGTLEEGDCLWVIPVLFDALQPGDVVAFEFGGKVVAHRIVGREGNGFATQGDGNDNRDSTPLTAERLIGKVVARERKGVRKAVIGGNRGRQRARILRSICWIRHSSAFWTVRLLRTLPVRHVVSWLWRPVILSVGFMSPQGGITKFIHQGRTVAIWNPQSRRWNCRMPYDLIISPPVQ